MSRRRTALVAMAAPIVGAPLLLGAPAEARVLDREVIHEEYSDTVENWCGEPGLTVEVVGTYDARVKVTTKGRRQLVHFAGHERIDETQTANGVTTRVVVRSLFKDLKVKDNGDGTLTIVILGTGNATLYGPNGKAVARDPGQVRFRLIVDHGGTPADPDDDVEISFDQIKGSTGRSDDFCAAWVALFS
jgi:hypothetical protein